MTGVDASDGSDDSAPQAAAGLLTNAQRLRVHLVKGGLAETLLDAWQGGDADGAQARMLTALHEFLNSVAA